MTSTLLTGAWRLKGELTEANGFVADTAQVIYDYHPKSIPAPCIKTMFEGSVP
jgi:hypothetical protein